MTRIYISVFLMPTITTRALGTTRVTPVTIPRSKIQAGRDAIFQRIYHIHKEVGDDFPYFEADDGTWITTPDGNWCGGHWIGLLWMAAMDVDDPDRAGSFRKSALDHTEVLQTSMTRQSMFFGMNAMYAGFRAFDITGDRCLFALGLEGADSMVDLFHQFSRQIPLGLLDIKGPDEFRGPDTKHGPRGDSIAAVDNIYTALPVLWRAYEETMNTDFRDTAIAHADRHIDWFIKNDGSTWHHAVFDGESGELKYQYNELAQSDSSCWSRGQGWNIAGLSIAWEKTGAERYLRYLEKTVSYFEDNTPQDQVPFWDFQASESPEPPRDTSAAAITAYGLTYLTGESKRVEKLRSYGETILESLIENYLCTDVDQEDYGVISNGCFNKPGEYATNNQLIWTYYYLATAINRYD